MLYSTEEIHPYLAKSQSTFNGGLTKLLMTSFVKF